mgnify:CR=1 FL=1
MAEKRKPVMIFNLKGPLIEYIAEKNKETGAWASGRQKGTKTLCIELFRATDFPQPKLGTLRRRRYMSTMYRVRMNGRWYKRPLKNGEREDPTYMSLYEIRDMIWRSAVKPINDPQISRKVRNWHESKDNS